MQVDIAFVYMSVGISLVVGIILGKLIFAPRNRYFKQVMTTGLDGSKKEEWVEVDTFKHIVK